MRNAFTTTDIAALPRSQLVINRPEAFDQAAVLDSLRHYLPSQSALKDFIHHNPLHSFQDQRFYDAIFRASEIFGYAVTLQLNDYRELYISGRIRQEVLEMIIRDRKGAEHLDQWKERLIHAEYDCNKQWRTGRLREKWKEHCRLDLDNLVQPLLFRVLCSYLDQGIASWKFPCSDGGFLASVRELEANSLTSLFRTSRARKLLLKGECDMQRLLEIIVGDQQYFEQYLFDQQFSHRGWSGMVATLETMPQSLLDRRAISLHDLVVFELLLELDALDAERGSNWQPLARQVQDPPVDLFAPAPLSELNEVLSLWQDAFEWSYYDEVLAGIAVTKKKPRRYRTSKSFQAILCIDERECSLRRYLEDIDPYCETFGTPGFFGVEFYFKPKNAVFYDKLCPAPVTPKHLIREESTKHVSRQELLYHPAAHTWLRGALMTFSLGVMAGVRLFQNLFFPRMSPAISNAFAHMNRYAKLKIENRDPGHMENGLQVGFTVEEMTTRVESVLRSIGLVRNFARIIYIVAHGSSSANNPHHGAHDCGACSGRPGSVNAKVFAFMANHPEVRRRLAAKWIRIPEETVFVGALHDTASDRIEFYNDTRPGEMAHTAHRRYSATFERALELNAKERSRRFASIKTKREPEEVHRDIAERSVSMFEPRPELGHGTNTLCVVGERHLTKGLFLDRRAFLNSYDHKLDPEGRILAGVMRPLGPVCGGINLEYYFSRVDNHKLGAGTKLPHNVMGLIGVANSSDGDLRPGLPWQMIEVHDPVRLLILVEHFPDVVLKAIQSSREMYEWYLNEWVHLVAVHPESEEFLRFRNGEFIPYKPLKDNIEKIHDMEELVSSAMEMETNHILDATRENLPVFLIK